MAGIARIEISYDAAMDIIYAPFNGLFRFTGINKRCPMRQIITSTIESELLPEGDNGLVKLVVDRKQTIDTVSWTIRFDPVT